MSVQLGGPVKNIQYSKPISPRPVLISSNLTALPAPPFDKSSLKGKKLTRLSEGDTKFPKLEECAHFHYEHVELEQISLSISEEDQENVYQDSLPKSNPIHFILCVCCQNRQWNIRRSYEDCRQLDYQLHCCIFDRKFSQLPELRRRATRADGKQEPALQKLVALYLARFSAIAGSMINCSPVLSWMEMDNRGNRLILSDDSAINTPAVGAAHVVKRYSAQASDEISFEVGDIISIIDMPPSEETNWWRGKKDYDVGFFPSECVEMIGQKVPHAMASKIPATPPKPVLRKRGKLISFLRMFFTTRPARSSLKRSGIVRERVFGCDLGEHLLNSDSTVPLVLKTCAEAIESHGIVDGIYRLSGVASNIQRLRIEFDEDRKPNLSEELYLQDVHCISSLLKMYFRELPNPLLTYQLYDQFIDAVQNEENTRIVKIHHVIQQLPPPHYRTAEYLIKHLARVATFGKQTGMHCKNLAIVWAPNLLRSKELESSCNAAALQGVGIQAIVTEFLIMYADFLFIDRLPAIVSPDATASSIEMPRRGRPKSLAISTPTKLLSLEEARERALSTNNSSPKQKYIDVGGGPDCLPPVYHTVLDLHLKKHCHSPSATGWRSFFIRHRTHSFKNSSKSGSLKRTQVSGVRLVNHGERVLTEQDLSYHRRLRSVKSADSLFPGAVSSNLVLQKGAPKKGLKKYGHEARHHCTKRASSLDFSYSESESEVAESLPTSMNQMEVMDETDEECLSMASAPPDSRIYAFNWSNEIEHVRYNSSDIVRQTSLVRNRRNLPSPVSSEHTSPVLSPLKTARSVSVASPQSLPVPKPRKIASDGELGATYQLGRSKLHYSPVKEEMIPIALQSSPSRRAVVDDGAACRLASMEDITEDLTSPPAFEAQQLSPNFNFSSDDGPAISPSSSEIHANFYKTKFDKSHADVPTFTTFKPAGSSSSIADDQDSSTDRLLFTDRPCTTDTNNGSKSRCPILESDIDVLSEFSAQSSPSEEDPFNNTSTPNQSPFEMATNAAEFSGPNNMENSQSSSQVFATEIDEDVPPPLPARIKRKDSPKKYPAPPPPPLSLSPTGNEPDKKQLSLVMDDEPFADLTMPTLSPLKIPYVASSLLSNYGDGGGGSGGDLTLTELQDRYCTTSSSHEEGMKEPMQSAKVIESPVSPTNCLESPILDYSLQNNSALPDHREPHSGYSSSLSSSLSSPIRLSNQSRSSSFPVHLSSPLHGCNETKRPVSNYSMNYNNSSTGSCLDNSSSFSESQLLNVVTFPTECSSTHGESNNLSGVAGSDLLVLLKSGSSSPLDDSHTASARSPSNMYSRTEVHNPLYDTPAILLSPHKADSTPIDIPASLAESMNVCSSVGSVGSINSHHVLMETSQNSSLDMNADATEAPVSPWDLMEVDQKDRTHTPMDMSPPLSPDMPSCLPVSNFNLAAQERASPRVTVPQPQQTISPPQELVSPAERRKEITSPKHISKLSTPVEEVFEMINRTSGMNKENIEEFVNSRKSKSTKNMECDTLAHSVGYEDKKKSAEVVSLTLSNINSAAQPSKDHCEELIISPTKKRSFLVKKGVDPVLVDLNSQESNDSSQESDSYEHEEKGEYKSKRGSASIKRKRSVRELTNQFETTSNSESDMEKEPTRTLLFYRATSVQTSARLPEVRCSPEEQYVIEQRPKLDIKTVSMSQSMPSKNSFDKDNDASSGESPRKLPEFSERLKQFSSSSMNTTLQSRNPSHQHSNVHSQIESHTSVHPSEKSQMTNANAVQCEKQSISLKSDPPTKSMAPNSMIEGADQEKSNPGHVVSPEVQMFSIKTPSKAKSAVIQVVHRSESSTKPDVNYSSNSQRTDVEQTSPVKESTTESFDERRKMFESTHQSTKSENANIPRSRSKSETKYPKEISEVCEILSVGTGMTRSMTADCKPVDKTEKNVAKTAAHSGAVNAEGGRAQDVQKVQDERSVRKLSELFERRSSSCRSDSSGSDSRNNSERESVWKQRGKTSVT